ncbi:MAG: peptidoglycan-binding protein [Acidimicrobiia bacterium]
MRTRSTRSTRLLAALALGSSMTLATAGAAGAQSAPAPDGDLRSISEGESGTLVAYWQDRLNDWLALSDADIAPVPVDGVYQGYTIDVTRAFQARNGTVAVDAVVDPVDRVALHNAIAALERGEGSSLRVINPGESGTLVAWWQERLNTWIGLSDTDLAPVAVDGIFGPNTQTATRVFQEATDSVPTDGVVHPEDRVALRDAIDALQQQPADGDLREISLGETGTLVAWWQDRLSDWISLSDAAIEPIRVDGIYGPNTRAATEYFQTVNGSVAVDGIVHPADRVALEQSIDALETGEVTPGAGVVELSFDGLAVPVATTCWLGPNRFSATTVGEVTVTVDTTGGTVQAAMDAEGQHAETSNGTTEVVGSSMRYTARFGPNPVGPETVVITLNATPAGCP